MWFTPILRTFTALLLVVFGPVFNSKFKIHNSKLSFQGGPPSLRNGQKEHPKRPFNLLRARHAGDDEVGGSFTGAGSNGNGVELGGFLSQIMIYRSGERI
jgi:hypothetical protein